MMRLLILTARHANLVRFFSLAFIIAITIFVAASTETVLAGPSPTGP